MVKERFAATRQKCFIVADIHRLSITVESNVTHLMAVRAIVMEWAAMKDTAIAALLHDAVEDQGGLETLARHR